MSFSLLLMTLHPPRCTLTDQHFPYTTLFRSAAPSRNCHSHHRLLFDAAKSGSVLSLTCRRSLVDLLLCLAVLADAIGPGGAVAGNSRSGSLRLCGVVCAVLPQGMEAPGGRASRRGADRQCLRSEEHTSELQSLMRISYAVFCLKKKKHLNTR